jgi:hypothetical protein
VGKSKKKFEANNSLNEYELTFFYKIEYLFTSLSIKRLFSIFVKKDLGSMIIYNTTYSVSDKVYGSFLKWVKEKHIPQMISSGYFSEFKLSRVLTDEDQEGNSISLQLTAENVNAVSQWREQYGDLFEMEISSLFSVNVLYFSTFLEIID